MRKVSRVRAMDKPVIAAETGSTPAADVARRVAALAAGYSLEVSSRSARDLDACLTHLEKGSDVYINFIAGDDLGAKVRCAAALQASGFRPVPHIGARHLKSRAQLDDLLARLAGEGGVDRALLIAGDAAAPAGPFDSSLAVLASGLLQKHGFRAAGFAGYPEGHPQIAPAELKRALTEKLALAAERGIEPYVVTQFCFEPEAVTAWLAALRRDGIAVPVRIGLAGPANIATLVRFAIRCGVTNSIRALTGRADRFLRLVSDSAPDALVRGIAEAAETAGADAPLLAGVAGFHFFPFGGVAKTARWANAVKRGRFRIAAGGGLDVEV
jgi:methylenetetrahydrofolate reductase (NADPH)